MKKRVDCVFLAFFILMLLPAHTLAVPGKSQVIKKRVFNRVTTASKTTTSTQKTTPPTTTTATTSTSSTVATTTAPTPTTTTTATAIATTTTPVTTTTSTTSQTTTSGEHIYISQSGSATGTGSGCSSAKPVAWLNTATNWGDGSGKVSAGDTVHLCGVISQTVYVLGNGAPGNPVTVRFEPGARLSSPAWDASRGGLYAKGRQFVLIDGAGVGIIENTANGSALQYKVQSTGLILSDCQNCEVRNLTVSNIYQRTSPSDPNGSSYGIVLMGNSTNSSVHDCVVTNVWRALCIHYSEMKSSNVSVYNNTAIKTCIGISIGSTGTGAVAENINIFKNKVSDNYVWDGVSTDGGWWHVDGVHAFAVHTGAAIYGLNIYSNEIGSNLGTHVTSWIYIEGAGISNVNVYNNLLTSAGGSYPSQGYIGLKKPVGVNVYNNTIAAGSGKGTGVNLWVGAASVDIRNNIFYRVSSGVYVGDTSTMKMCDKNNYYGLGNNQMYYQTRFYTLADWQSTLGFDRNSIMADPLLSSEYRPASTSPVRAKGDNLGNPFNIDKAGVIRPYTGWTLGAYQ